MYLHRKTTCKSIGKISASVRNIKNLLLCMRDYICAFVNMNLKGQWKLLTFKLLLFFFFVKLCWILFAFQLNYNWKVLYKLIHLSIYTSYYEKFKILENTFLHNFMSFRERISENIKLFTIFDSYNLSFLLIHV